MSDQRFNTGNPIGSDSPLDRSDNTRNFDVLENTRTLTEFPDRFGVPRKTRYGMEVEFDADQASRESQFSTAQSSREDRFNTFIASSGYQFAGDYAAGIEITEYNQLIRDSGGEFWRVSGQVDLPYVTTGAGIPEDDALVPAGDAVVRQDLADPNKGAAMVARGVVAMESIEALLSLPQAQRSADKKYLVKGAVFGWDGAKFSPESSVPLEAFGVKPGAEYDNGLAFSLMYTFLEDFEGTITCGPGRFRADSTLRIPRKAAFQGAGKGKTIFDATGSSASFTENTVVLKVGSTPVRMENLVTEAKKGSFLVGFAGSHELEKGDVFLIYNPLPGSFNASRDTYRDGQFCTVAQVVSSSVVEVDRPLYSNYPASVVEVYRCPEMAEGDLFGFTALAPGVEGGNNIVTAVRTDYLHNSRVDDVEGRDSDNASLTLAHCYRVRGQGVVGFQWTEAPGFGTQYGCVIGNSQEVDLTGDFTGRRHGITTGGGASFGIPCRDIHVHSGTSTNRAGSLASIDWHGNTEHSSYQNMAISGGGFSISGNNNTVKGIRGGGEDMLIILGREILGCNHTVEDIDVWTGRNDTSRGLMDIGGNTEPMNAVKTLYGGTFTFRGIKVEAPNNTGSSGINIRNRGFEGVWNVVYDDIEINSPNVSATQSVASCSTVSGTPPATLSAKSLRGQGGYGKNIHLGSAEINNTLVRMDGEAGWFNVEIEAGTSLLTLPIEFSRAFPKTPRFEASISIGYTSAGSDRIMAVENTLTASGAGVRIMRTDLPGGQFAASASRRLKWSAEIADF